MLRVKDRVRNCKWARFFEYTIKIPSLSEDTFLVYGEIDDGYPLIYSVSTAETGDDLPDDQFEKYQDEIYNSVMEEWFVNYSSYLDAECESMKDRYYGI